MLNEETILVGAEDAGQRLDTLLASRFPNYSRTYFQFLIEEGCVLVAGKIFKKRERPRVGDEIEICFLLTPELSLEPENIALDILYEDEHFLSVNKPVGMVVHPGPGHPRGTFANALLFHCKNLHAAPGDLRPGIVHRLDKETSGLLLAAKTAGAHQKLVALFAERKIEKHYRALCLGTPKEGEIRLPIARHPTKRQEMCVLPEKGKDAISIVRLLAKKGEFSLIEVQLVTGRTHQIRVHLKHLGHPILGDPVYGSSSLNLKKGFSRQLLHAHTMRFIHPFTSAPIRLEAPLPPELRLD